MFVLFVLIFQFVSAHPVIWDGGIEHVCEYSNKHLLMTHHRSYAATYSFGYRYNLYCAKRELINIEWLCNGHLYRWNRTSSQSNLYSLLTLGVNNRNQIDASVGCQYDWETREKYLLFRSVFTTQKSTLTSRIGTVLNKGGFYDAHYWAILERYDVITNGIRSVKWFPIIRIVRPDYLFEYKYDHDDGSISTTLMVHI